jgi:hypothetical protein
MIQLQLYPFPPRLDPWGTRWDVASRSVEGKTYTVARAVKGSSWGCSCPQWIYYRKRCHHIRAVQEGRA